MTEPIHNLDLGQRAHRLLWWLLANQGRDKKGIPNGIVADNWRERAAKELGLPRNGVWKAQCELRDAGVITLEPRNPTVTINAEAFK